MATPPCLTQALMPAAMECEVINEKGSERTR